ncbi:MAG: YncE family protein, partial [Chloroflexi bacterium]|nr:YncE family protein [Chloroflexota bacterium]
MKHLSLMASLCFVLVMSALITEPADAALDVVGATPTGARPDSVAINTITRRVYVSHDTPLPSDSFVTVINADTNAVITTIGVGKTAVDIAVNQVTNRIYVANGDSNSISVIDGATNSVITTVPVTPNAPNAVAVDEAANRFVVGTGDTGHVEVFNGATNTFMCASSVFQFPETVYSVAVNPINGRIYAHYNPGKGAIVDGSTCGILLNNIPTCSGGHADQLIYNPVDSRFYGTTWNGSSIGGYSGSTGATVFCEG